MRSSSADKRTEVVTATGYYGMSNFGDDLFCAVLAQRLPDVFPRARVFVAGPAVPGVDARYVVPSSILPASYSATTRSGSMMRLGVGLYAWLRSDAIVLGGGSILTGVDGVRRAQMHLDRLRRPQLYGFGVSIGPLRTVADASAVRALVRRFTFLTVRDRPSMELATEMGVGDRTRLSGDLAALMRVTPQSHSSGRLGLAPCDYPGLSRDAVRASLTRLASVVQEGAFSGIDLFALNNHRTTGDDDLTYWARDVLAGLGLRTALHRYVDDGLDGTVRRLAALSGLVSGRLHGALVGYLLGVPVAVVDYHAKCRDFAEDVGLPAPHVIPSAFDHRAVMAAVRAIRNRQPPQMSPAAYVERAQDAHSDIPS